MLSRLPVIVFALLILLTTQAMAQPPQAQGEVTVPLPAYTELLEQTREEDRPAQGMAAGQRLAPADGDPVAGRQGGL